MYEVIFKSQQYSNGTRRFLAILLKRLFSMLILRLRRRVIYVWAASGVDYKYCDSTTLLFSSLYMDVVICTSQQHSKSATRSWRIIYVWPASGVDYKYYDSTTLLCSSLHMDVVTSHKHLSAAQQRCD